jgi:hypothetical protein
MRYIVLALALCFGVSSVEAKPRTVTSHKVKARKNKVKGRKAAKRPVAHRNTAN